MSIFIYVLYALFRGGSYFYNMIVRAVFCMPVITLVMVNRIGRDDDMSFTQAWSLSAMAFALVEISVYINMKAKARLFLKVKTSEQ